jgi:hypothetical protein
MFNMPNKMQQSMSTIRIGTDASPKNAINKGNQMNMNSSAMISTQSDGVKKSNNSTAFIKNDLSQAVIDQASLIPET